MLMPSIFGENLLDDFFGFPFDGDYNYNASGNLSRISFRERLTAL